jgi:hypothetical protein
MEIFVYLITVLIIGTMIYRVTRGARHRQRVAKSQAARESAQILDTVREGAGCSTASSEASRPVGQQAEQAGPIVPTRVDP